MNKRQLALSVIIMVATFVWGQSPIVKVEGGYVQGVASASSDITVFRGIPYAAPPVGDLRWKRPQPVEKWKGVRKADWLMSEAFCLYEDRDRFLPYEKHHSTVLDAARLAESLSVRNLILYHTEDRTLDTRRQRYTAEAKTVFSGRVVVPDDLERIIL